jgi:hypothetical protein
MTKIITTIAFFICSLLSAQGQFEQGMGKALQLWGEGKNTEASDLFERIAAAEPKSWLPNYYVALVNVTTAFKTKDNLQVSSIKLVGSDFEQVSTDDLLYVYVTVENNFDEKVEDVQVTFLLPELGKFKSSRRTLSSGDSESFTILVDVPYYFEEGYYYPKIIVAGKNVDKRVKISYFEAVN